MPHFLNGFDINLVYAKQHKKEENIITLLHWHDLFFNGWDKTEDKHCIFDSVCGLSVETIVNSVQIWHFISLSKIQFLGCFMNVNKKHFVSRLDQHKMMRQKRVINTTFGEKWYNSVVFLRVQYTKITNNPFIWLCRLVHEKCTQFRTQLKHFYCSI